MDNAADGEVGGRIAVQRNDNGDSVGGADMTFWTSLDGAVVLEKLRIKDTGHVEPGLTEAYNLGSSAKEWNNLYVQNAVTVSDERRKEQIVDSHLGLDFINKLRPVSYKRKNYDYEVMVKEAVAAVEGKDAVYETKEAVYETKEVSPAVEATDEHPGKEAATEVMVDVFFMSSV